MIHWQHILWVLLLRGFVIGVGNTYKAMLTLWVGQPIHPHPAGTGDTPVRAVDEHFGIGKAGKRPHASQLGHSHPAGSYAACVLVPDGR